MMSCWQSWLIEVLKLKARSSVRPGQELGRVLRQPRRPPGARKSIVRLSRTCVSRNCISGMQDSAGPVTLAGGTPSAR